MSDELEVKRLMEKWAECRLIHPGSLDDPLAFYQALALFEQKTLVGGANERPARFGPPGVYNSP